MSLEIRGPHQEPIILCSWCNMGSIERINAKTIQRLGNDSVYGQGTDGDVVISSNTTLTSDKYYSNLTVNSGITLLTNGYRVFVKGTLTNNGFIGVGTAGGGEPSTSFSNTIIGPTALTGITYSLGGVGGGSTANSAPVWLVQNIERLLEGELATRLFTPSAGQSAGLLYGGTAGVTGAQGHTNPAYTNNDNWTGKSGNAGSAGVIYNSFGGGSHHHSNDTAEHSGGAVINAGNAGSPGTAPNSGGAGAGGAGGVGGVGGGLVLIFAKTITGTGTIFSKGQSGGAGSAGSTGAAGSAGANGNTGYTASNVHYSHICFNTDAKGNCNHTAFHAYRNYHGGAGGTGGAGSPTKTGGQGESGYKGGGGAIIIVSDSTPSGQTYTVSAGSSGTGTATSGVGYIILNN